MPNEIVLQLGTEFVETSEIPALIAEALYPESPDEPQLIIGLTKTAKPGIEGARGEGWPTAIDDADLDILKGFFTDLPPLELPITIEAWQPYAEAFKVKGAHLDWNLTCIITSPSHNAAQRRTAERNHLKKLISAIRSKKLKVCEADTRIQSDEYHTDAIVMLENFKNYVAEFNISLRMVVKMPETEKVQTVRGITKSQVIAAFEDLHFNAEQWRKYLGSPAPWLKKCRVAKGNKTTSALWDPVQIATALSGKKVPIKKLDAVFVHLKEWAKEWQAASDIFRGY